MGAGVSVAANGLGTDDDDRIAEAHTLYVELQPSLPSLHHQAGMVAEHAFNNAPLMEFIFGEGKVG